MQRLITHAQILIAWMQNKQLLARAICTDYKSTGMSGRHGMLSDTLPQFLPRDFVQPIKIDTNIRIYTATFTHDST